MTKAMTSAFGVSFMTEILTEEQVELITPLVRKEIQTLEAEGEYTKILEQAIERMKDKTLSRPQAMTVSELVVAEMRRLKADSQDTAVLNDALDRMDWGGERD